MPSAVLALLRLRALAVFAALLLGGCPTLPTQLPGDFDQKIARAHTRADHEALAEYYEQEATLLHGKAQDHERRALAYGPPANYGRLEDGLKQHCNNLARRYREAAETNLALARLHREAAGAVRR